MYENHKDELWYAQHNAQLVCWELGDIIFWYVCLCKKENKPRIVGEKESQVKCQDSRSSREMITGT